MYSKILLFASCLLVTSSISAQINKGAILVGGDLGFSTQKTDYGNEKNNTFNISPAVGKAIKENLILGVDLGFRRSISEREEIPVYKNENNRYGGGIFLRKYAMIAKSFYLFGQGRVGGYLEDGNNASNGSEYTSDRYGIDLAVYPGIAYAITKKLQLEAGFPHLFSIGYSSQKNSSPSSNEPVRTKSFGAWTSLTSGAPLNIGIRLLLNGKSN